MLFLGELPIDEGTTSCGVRVVNEDLTLKAACFLFLRSGLIFGARLRDLHWPQHHAVRRRSTERF